MKILLSRNMIKMRQINEGVKMKETDFNMQIEKLTKYKSLKEDRDYWNELLKDIEESDKSINLYIHTTKYQSDIDTGSREHRICEKDFRFSKIKSILAEGIKKEIKIIEDEMELI